MADKTIWEYPTLMTAQPEDLILMASDEETFNMKVQTLKNAMGEAASKPPIVRNGNWWTWSAYVEDYVDSGTAATGPQGIQGATGAAAGFGTVSATVDNNTGTPSVDVTSSGPSTAKNFSLAFHNIKGDKGDTGNAAGFGSVSATIDATVGTPSVEVTASGPATARNFAFAFHNMKGEPGDPINVAKYTVTIPTTGWTQPQSGLYTVTVSVQGIRDTDDCGMVLLLQTGTESTDVNLRTNYSKITRITAGTNSITAHSTAVPSVAIPIQITVIR